jgi:endonuclease YncB( thermonuclease family)
MKKIITLILAVVLIDFTSTTFADSNVKVVDGDSLEINERRIRLLGIDAPEYMQVCEDENGQPYFCGQKAQKFLENIIKTEEQKGHKVKCLSEGKYRYKRELCVCSVGNKTLNLEMVKNGYAISYKDDRYQKLEKRAKKEKKGIWQGKFMRPEIYRSLQRHEKKS